MEGGFPVLQVCLSRSLLTSGVSGKEVADADVIHRRMGHCIILEELQDLERYITNVLCASTPPIGEGTGTPSVG